MAAALVVMFVLFIESDRIVTLVYGASYGQAIWLQKILVVTVAFAFFMPSVAIILQAKLSRAREFAADLGATELLGTPDYLIRALLKLENYNRPFMLPWIRRAQNYFGTHPNTLQRVQRLESYTQR